MDFTIKKYEQLCSAISESDYENITFEEYFNRAHSNLKHFIILRHDVDKDCKYALDLALREKQFGLRATYYFRVKPGLYDPDIIAKIAACGHEVGYHYETVDKCHGNLDQAIDLFGVELALLRQTCGVRTACMHGNPLTKFDNKEIWKRRQLSEFSLLGEPYLSVDYKQIAYFSESGRTWRTKTWRKSKDVIQNYRGVINPRNTDELIEAVKRGEHQSICLLTHPERWNKNFAAYLGRYLIDMIYVIGKGLIRLKPFSLRHPVS